MDSDSGYCRDSPAYLYQYRGVQSGKFLQNIFTGSKIIALLGLIALGFILVDASHLSENFSLGSDSFNNLKKDLSGIFLKKVGNLLAE
jgi:APA family basic amino acid/polyamine antiporter